MQGRVQGSQVALPLVWGSASGACAWSGESLGADVPGVLEAVGVLMMDDEVIYPSRHVCPSRHGNSVNARWLARPNPLGRATCQDCAGKDPDPACWFCGGRGWIAYYLPEQAGALLAHPAVIWDGLESGNG